MTWALPVGVKVRGIWGQSVGGWPEPVQWQEAKHNKCDTKYSPCSRPGERANDIGPWWALKRLGHLGSERRWPELVQWQEAKQKKCRALAGAGVPAQAMPAVNGTRSSARSGVAYRLVGTTKQQSQQIQAT